MFEGDQKCSGFETNPKKSKRIKTMQLLESKALFVVEVSRCIDTSALSNVLRHFTSLVSIPLNPSFETNDL